MSGEGRGSLAQGNGVVPTSRGRWRAASAAALANGGSVSLLANVFPPRNARAAMCQMQS